MPVEVAVVEVGLLGRYDATNVVRSDVAVITNIGKDHTDGAPGWERAVASEKAGIIKAESVPVVGDVDDASFPIFEHEAQQPLLRSGTRDRVDDSRGRGRGPPARHLGAGRPLRRGVPAPARRPPGRECRHRPRRGRRVLRPPGGRGRGRGGVGRPPAAVAGRGGRREPLVVLDGAHNPGGARALARALTEFEASPRVAALGLLEGRDPAEMLDALEVAPDDLVVATRPPSPRAVEPDELARTARARGAVVDVVDDPVEAVEVARLTAGEHGLIVVTGSLYLTGAVRGELAG
ncbi:MAG: cyanophycin synthetase [Acidimicrobiia bacterium]|nr:cyanophycin synthetase [Acidimicrobiia bacterium]